jgi:hypothetical protein
MYFFRIFLIGSISLIVTACNKQEEVLSTKNTTLTTIQHKPQNKTQVIAPPIKLHDTVNSESQPKQNKPTLNLSIDSIMDENKKNNDALSINDNTIEEENSVLFNTLNRKHTEQKINLSGELLTDKNADEDTSYLKSVDGVQIDIKGNFK